MYVTRITVVGALLLGCGAVTSFDTSPTLTVWRALLAVAVVFVMLATTGWSAVRDQQADGPRELALAAWARDRIAGHSLPEVDAPAYRLAHFFATLTSGQRFALAGKYPSVVGNLDGAPVTLRYHANRVALRQAAAVEKVRAHDEKLSPDGRDEAQARLGRFRSLLRGERQILAFDPSEGPGGRGVRRSRPGRTGLRRRSRRRHPSADPERSKRRYAAPVGMAESLYGAERLGLPGHPYGGHRVGRLHLAGRSRYGRGPGRSLPRTARSG